MTLDEAIKHVEKVIVENLEKTKGRNAGDPIAINCFECAEEHRQLVEWLKDYKRLKKQEPCDVPDINVGDMISRQAVLDAMYELCDTGETLKENPWRDNPHIDAVVETIEQLPSVKLQEPCEDAISRQAAIDAANKVIERDTSGNNDVVNAMIAWSAYIKSLPPVKPQEPCEDAISRQKAIDAIDALYLDGDSPASHLANAEGDTLKGGESNGHNTGQTEV